MVTNCLSCSNSVCVVSALCTGKHWANHYQGSMWLGCCECEGVRVCVCVCVKGVEMKTKINSQHLALCQTVIKKPLCGQLPSRTRCCHCRPPCPLAPSMPLTRARGGCVCARVRVCARAWVRVRACVLCNWSEQWPTVPKYKRSLDNAFVCLFVCVLSSEVFTQVLHCYYWEPFPPVAERRSVVGIQDSHESATMRSSANGMSLLSPKAIWVLISCLQANQLWGEKNDMHIQCAPPLSMERQAERF